MTNKDLQEFRRVITAYQGGSIFPVSAEQCEDLLDEVQSLKSELGEAVTWLRNCSRKYSHSEEINWSDIEKWAELAEVDFVYDDKEDVYTSVPSTSAELLPSPTKQESPGEKLCDMAEAYLDLQEKMKEVGDAKDLVRKIRKHEPSDDGIEFEYFDHEAVSMVTAFTASQLLLKGEGEIVWEGDVLAGMERLVPVSNEVSFEHLYGAGPYSCVLSKPSVSGSVPESAGTACDPSPGASVNSDDGSVS